MYVDFEKDLLKHYVRKHGWLTAAKEQKHVIRNRSKNIPLRYFTFCAAEAIDVCMLECEGILERSEQTGHLESVYFCEKNPRDFARIADLIGLKAQGFLGEFDKIVLFRDDETTEGKTWDDGDFHPRTIRKKLIYKDAHHRLRQAFPFDIINLDVCGVMFPPRKGVMAPLLKSIIQILEWQTESRFPINDRECKQFTLFITSHIDPNRTNQNAIEQLKNRVTENINTNADFRSAFYTRYGHNQVDKLARERFAEFFCLALPKIMIHRALYDYGWRVTCGPTYLFNRDDIREENEQYQMMHTVSVYERIPSFRERLDDRSREQYIQSVNQLVETEVEWVDDVIKNPEINQELQENLDQIIELRDQRRNS